MSLQTETGNIPALTLYTAVGFELVTGLELLNLVLDPDDQDLRYWPETAKGSSSALLITPTVARLTGRPARTLARWSPRSC